MFPFFKEHDLSRRFAQFLDSVEARIATSKEYTSSLERQIEALTARLDTLETGTRENAIALREELMVRFGHQLEQLSDRVDTLEATMKRNEGVLSDTQKVTLGFEDRMQRLEELARTHGSEMVHVKKDQDELHSRFETQKRDLDDRLETVEDDVEDIDDQLSGIDDRLDERVDGAIEDFENLLKTPRIFDAHTWKEVELKPFKNIGGRLFFHVPIGGRKYLAGTNLSVYKVFAYNPSFSCDGYGAAAEPHRFSFSNGHCPCGRNHDTLLESFFVKKFEHYGLERKCFGVHRRCVAKGSPINYCPSMTDLLFDFEPPSERIPTTTPKDFAFFYFLLEAV